MSGPALRQRHAHHAIHESAVGEAEELTEILAGLLDASDYNKATMVVPVLVEHWQTRTLAHAEEEERGLYLEILADHPEKAPLIQSLKRDHALLRLALDDIKGVLGNLAVDEPVGRRIEGLRQVLDRFKTMLFINHIHSSTEETSLLVD